MSNEQLPLSEILDGLLDNSAPNPRRAEIGKLVGENQELIDEIIVQMRVHSLLQWQCGVVAPAQTEPTQSPKAASELSFGFIHALRTSTVHWRRAAAILVLITAAVSSFFMLRGKPQSSGSIAEIVDESRVVWSAQNSAVDSAKRIVPGILAMESGEVTLRFRSGATVSASGNVSMRIASDMLVLLDRGQATAHVPQWAKGFTIKTGSAEVIDLGTKFGVMAREGGTTDVVVFEGEVDLKATSTANSASAPKRLTQGEGARVEKSGEINRIVEINRNSGSDRWSTDTPTGGNSVFRSVRDNMHPADSTKYYAIVPHGLTDDALAYVDRPHEWNGLTAQGLPQFLEQADYIRTFNTTRYVANMEIVVEMAKAAEVYVFFDSRIPPPAWLIDGFEDTDSEIGLDVGPWQAGQTEPTVGVGGGNSVDTVFNVWKRRCKAGETIILGPLSKRVREVDCAMYGIAAKPLD
jgi:hypothetical protein